MTGMVFDPRGLKERRFSLDFANSIEWRFSDHTEETIHDYPALLAWGRKKGIVTESDRRHLREEAERHPSDADTVMERVYTLREAVYRIFSAFARDRTANDSDFSIFNAELARVVSASGIARTDGGFVWTYTGNRDALDRILWPIVLDAAYLLTSDMLKRVGECAADDCTWLFIDKSRNRSRQWCAMNDCGNRAKARRFYQRKQEARNKQSSTGSMPG